MNRELGGSEYSAIQRRYEVAMDEFVNASIEHAGAWFRPDVAAFSSLYSVILPFAESKDAWAQYAIATILSLGLRCSTQQEYVESYQCFLPTMSHWWASAAKQGHFDALDNLVTSGVGVEAEKARAVAKAIQQEMPGLIGSAQGMPSYGPDYFKELYKRFSGEAN